MEITANGIRLHYAKAGSGPALVLLHGNGEDHHIFDALLPHMARHFTVYAVDSRGHGQSEKANGYGYQTMMEDIHAFIEQLGIAPADIVGFSDGAILALLLAQSYPGSVRRMALLGPNLSPADFTAEALGWLQSAYAETQDPLVALMLEQPNIPLQSLADISTPALVVGAENDIFKPETFTSMAATLPNAQLAVIPGHEHDTYITGTGVLWPRLAAFWGVAEQ